MSTDTQASLIMIVVCIVLLITLVFGSNACTASEWNDGICPDCRVRYELRGVSDYRKYYVCPKCGREVNRY